jgi:hypothetical protein
VEAGEALDQLRVTIHDLPSAMLAR